MLTIKDVYPTGHPDYDRDQELSPAIVEDTLVKVSYAPDSEEAKAVIFPVLLEHKLITESLYRNYIEERIEEYSDYLLFEVNVKAHWVKPSVVELIRYKRKISLYRDPKTVAKIQAGMLNDFRTAAEKEYDADASSLTFERLLELFATANDWQNRTELRLPS